MTNEELIAKIKAEIERQLLEKDHGFEDGEAEYGYNTCLKDMRRFLSTLESEKPVPADLEEAAKRYGNNKHPMTPTGARESQEDFIAGAKWQEEKDQEIIKLAEDHAFLAGADWQKEIMMKEAVEVPVIEMGVNPSPYIVKRLEDNYKKGDKIRVIVLPKEN